MEEAREAVGLASFKSYISKRFTRRKSKKSKAPKEAPNALHNSYLRKASVQLASNQQWYGDDLSQATAKTVRLLYLEPGQQQDPIVGRLVCHPVNQKSRYDALSYSWGEQDDWTQITLNGIPGFSVTQTLCCALRRLRSTTVARPIWIDAICINQSNTAERNQQVGMMESTFGSARSVLIWLGDCDNDEFADHPQSLAYHIVSKVESETHDTKKAWWNRLWVVQEVALAKELMVYFGPHVLTWADFFMSAETRSTFRGVVNLKTVRAFVQNPGLRHEDCTLEKLLALTGNCYASDPLDYIFGLIGLVPEQERVREHRLSPDYTLTPYELFTRLSIYLDPVGYQLAGASMLNQMLSWTASVGHLQLAKLLLESAQIDLATEGPLALCYAAEKGRVSMLKLLLDEFDLNANSRNSMGRTPLFWAATWAQTEAVKLLIYEHHADPCARDDFGRTPLSWAAASRPEVPFGEGRMDGSLVARTLDTVRAFLDVSEVDADSEDAKGRTPLAWAVFAGCKPVVELLLDTGRTDPSRRFGGQPLVAWAFELGYSSIAELLVERRVPNWKVNTQTEWNKLTASGQAGNFDHSYWLDDLGEECKNFSRPPSYTCWANRFDQDIWADVSDEERGKRTGHPPAYSSS